MMKPFFLSLCVFLLVHTAPAQVMIGKVAYQKSQQTAAIIELPYSTGVVEGAIKDNFAKRGVRTDQSRGFMLFKNVQFAPSDPTSSDLYFKVDRKNRKDDNLSVVYLVVAKQNEDVSKRSVEDNYGMERASTFFNEVTPSIEAYALEVQIKDQQDKVNNAEKRYRELIDDGKDLEKKKRDIEDKITENISEQEKHRLELERQRQEFNALISRRRG